MLPEVALKRCVGLAVDQTDDEIGISEAFADAHGGDMPDRDLADRCGFAEARDAA